jgi:membrane protease YdiL (CAAX protease family)
MSLKFMHQVIIFAAIGISIIFGIWCFTDSSVAGDPRFMVAGVLSGFAIVALIAYEIYFLRKTRRLIIS